MLSETLSPAKVALYDTTLRDGSQRKGISLSIADKIKIALLLDQFGIPYIECGWPGSNPKDCDTNLLALRDANTPAVAIVGKSWTLHVEKVLETSLNENLKMIEESTAWLKSLGREVIYDAEHFFDGFRADRAYALQTVKAAMNGGADWIVLCDTNGGSLPIWIEQVVADVKDFLANSTIGGTRPPGLGIHVHNDAELAVANSISAVLAGATQIQGTINGYGERCGNANLISIIPNLQLKLGIGVIPPENLGRLTEISNKVSEIVNLNPDTQAPYVGTSAFAHKGGIHVAAVEKVAESYEHVPPEIVGNRREIVVSELAGRGNIRIQASRLGHRLDGLEGTVLEKIKFLESKGFQFENAEGSFDLLLARSASDYQPAFKLLDAMVVSERRVSGRRGVQAIVKIEIGEEIAHVASDGDGPVHALDAALRKALRPAIPQIDSVHLTDYKVRILDPDNATAAITRVLIEASSGNYRWATVGCSENIIEASLDALCDSLEFFIRNVCGRETAGQEKGAADRTVAGKLA
jgi:2-isopropylmalate synthase